MQPFSHMEAWSTKGHNSPNEPSQPNPLLQYNRWCIVNHVCLLDNNEFGVANMVVVVQHGIFFSSTKLHDIHSLVAFDFTHFNPT